MECETKMSTESKPANSQQKKKERKIRKNPVRNGTMKPPYIRTDKRSVGQHFFSLWLFGPFDRDARTIWAMSAEAKFLRVRGGGKREEEYGTFSDMLGDLVALICLDCAVSSVNSGKSTRNLRRFANVIPVSLMATGTEED